jgi:hypothetical protein
MTTRAELLERCGRYYGEQRFAIAWTQTNNGAGGDAKAVKTAGWQNTKPLPDGDFGAGLFRRRGESRNPAVVLRPSGLVAVECDGEEDLALVEELGLPETLTVRSSSEAKRHYYFRPPGGLETVPFVAFRFESGKLTADSGRYFVCPPALHPSGAVYSFLPGHGPGEAVIAEMPEAVYRRLAERAREEDGALKERIRVDPEAKIVAGNRRDMLFRYACMLRRWGLSREEIASACHAYNATRCEPPVESSLVEVQVTGAMRKQGGQELDDATGSDEAAAPMRVVAVEAFAAVDEPSAEPLLGDERDTVLSAGGALVFYGAGGAGKTTLEVDLIFHLAAGVPWLGLPVPRPCRVLVVENEGPRGKFRMKLRQKLASWAGPPVEGRISVLEEPWALFSFASEDHRATLRGLIEEHGFDVIAAGPVQRLGMQGGGTPEEVGAFILNVELTRARLERPVAVVLAHHENKAGQVAGAWEGVPDTLAHVQARGNGATRLFWQKVRWGSTLHGKPWTLLWRDGEGFELEEAPEITDDDVADSILAVVRENPGASMRLVEREAVGRTERKRETRDRLLEEGRLVNLGGEGRFKLYLPDDPTVSETRPLWGAPGAHSAPDTGSTG